MEVKPSNSGVWYQPFCCVTTLLLNCNTFLKHSLEVEMALMVKRVCEVGHIYPV
jgi:hypothetical protein